ncbi:MAG TPA: glycoside hydrolase domain-containing protein [Terriglobales bacterium]|nr:glycoside hydrolase domain-containing protein [Terriglobales bacterium]
MARAIVLSLLMAFLAGGARSQSDPTQSPSFHLGFDRNHYPGDENLKALHQTFAYAGYWLNNPPGENRNSWIGHRGAVESAGFGFLVLFNGHLYAELKSVSRAAWLGKSDAQTAVAAAKREGFPAGTVIFLDQEQGGRMLPAQKAYIYAWLDGVNAQGFATGIYCSGMAAADDQGVITAEDIRADAGGRKITYWVTNDACPPSPGCAFPRQSPNPADSGISFAEVWQFAQSPKRAKVAAGCPKDHDRDGSCYAPANGRIDVDVDAASSEDPSRGRSAHH